MRNIKPIHKAIKTFYAELKQYENLGATNETEVRLAFPNFGNSLRLANDWQTSTTKTNRSIS